MSDYIIVEQYDHKSLYMRVNDWIKDGYEPVGGIAVLPADRHQGPRFYQAMMKKGVRDEK